jgi:LPS O-antigen subunit length determinant protein (WzzB/FepE family)
MENDMQLKFNAYSTINTQLEAAKAKVQERTPAFTMLKGASVPIKPAGPKRMLFVIFMLAVATLATTTYILRCDILKIIELREKK